MTFEGDIVIGLEVHVSLNTKTKLFCSCRAKESAIPNSQTCQTCLGHPGAMPVLNEKALENALKVSMALDCKVLQNEFFSRKSYFYPDMSKNFQITQFEKPVAANGKIKLKSGKEVGITRVHLEEDPAALVHEQGISSSDFTLIDYNRSGNPLIEIVTEPQIASAKEAREFLKELTTMLEYLNVISTNSTVKADANASIRETNYMRVEIKNVNGLKEIEKALKYEIGRQKALAKRGLKIKRETRSWNETSRTTRPLRQKEVEEEYGYIAEPDLPEIELSEKELQKIKENIPELALQKAQRLQKQYGISKEDADVLAAEKDFASLFEQVCEEVADAKLVAKWVRRELKRVLHYERKTLNDSKFESEKLVELLQLLKEGKITARVGQKLIEKILKEGISPKEFVASQKMEKISSAKELQKVCEKVAKENEKAVKDYLQGNEKALHFLIGRAMKETREKADIKIATKILKQMMKK